MIYDRFLQCIIEKNNINVVSEDLNIEEDDELNQKNYIKRIVVNILGDWGLGIGDWAQSPIPNPQSPRINLYNT